MWADNSANEDGFEVERCTGAGCVNFSRVATLASSVTSYSNSGLAGNTTYRYRVRAFNASGNSAYAAAASATTPEDLAGAPLAAPANLTATAGARGSSRITLTWVDRAAGEQGFSIERCTGSDCTNFAQIATVAADVTTFVNTGVARNRYRYRVRAFAGAATSVYSNVAAARLR